MGKERVLITGGAGYLGARITEHLLNRGYAVICLDNLMHRQASLLHVADREGFDFVFGDVRDEGLVKQLTARSDVILPLAAIVGEGACKEREFDARTINQEAPAMINRVRSAGQKLVFPTTNSGYGLTTGDIHCTEETPLNPVSHYGMTKAAAEEAILKDEKKAVTLRLATVFGVSPRMRTDLLVNDFVLRAVRDRFIGLFEGDFMRNYIHVGDVARAFEHAIANYDSMSGAYNAGDDRVNMSKAQLAERIKRFVPAMEIAPMAGSDPDKRNYIVSSDKIRRTGFECRHTLDEGIAELMQAYKLLMKLDASKNA